MRIKNAAATDHPGAMEAHLNGKISLEKKIIEGAAKLLMTCKSREAIQIDSVRLWGHFLPY